MRKIISFMHISLDGFVAGPNGEMDWITVNEEIFEHIGKRISKSDIALYGRVTYQMMQSYWPTAADNPAATRHHIQHAEWYSKVHKLILSKTMKHTDVPNTTIICGDTAQNLKTIQQQPSHDILLFGSPSATHALMQLRLIDGYWLFVNPVILGQGIPLFADIRERIKLRLLTTQSFTGGVTELSYVVDSI